jgi:hypothetical protein
VKGLGAEHQNGERKISATKDQANPVDLPTMLPALLPESNLLARKYLKSNKLEARGIEPLSSSFSTQTSTCLAGDDF